MPTRYNYVADSSPLIDLSQLPSANSYLPMSGYNPSNLPTSNPPALRNNNNSSLLGSMGPYANMLEQSFSPGVPNPLALADALNSDDPMNSLLNSMTFGILGGGNSAPGYRAHVNDQGLWQWHESPTVNPVTVTGIPGATQAPSKEYQDMANNVRAIQDLMPYLTSAQSQANQQGAVSDLRTASMISPAYASLMSQLYNTYGSQLNAIGQEIGRRNALSEAQTQSEVLAGPGKDVVQQAYDTSQIFDRPYYDTRAATATRTGDLLKSINLGSGLTDTEREEIRKGLFRSNNGAAPSNMQTISNAVTYGAAGRKREQENKGALSAAIQTASSFLPTSKSGVDVFQVATGKPSVPNSGNSLFTGVQSGSGAGSQLTGNMLSGIGQLAGYNTQERMNAANIKANEKDWLDMMSQFTGSLSQLGSMAGGFAGMCWVAREVYGVNNPRWQQFRDYLMFKAPTWFRELYLQNGERFAKWIHNKPIIKAIVRKLFNFILAYE